MRIPRDPAVWNVIVMLLLGTVFAVYLQHRQNLLEQELVELQQRAQSANLEYYRCGYDNSPALSGGSYLVCLAIANIGPSAAAGVTVVLNSIFDIGPVRLEPPYSNVRPKIEESGGYTVASVRIAKLNPGATAILWIGTKEADPERAMAAVGPVITCENCGNVTLRHFRTFQRPSPARPVE